MRNGAIGAQPSSTPKRVRSLLFAVAWPGGNIVPSPAFPRYNHPMVKKLPQLGRSAAFPPRPTKRCSTACRNPHPDTNYVARFTFPEFT